MRRQAKLGNIFTKDLVLEYLQWNKRKCQEKEKYYIISHLWNIKKKSLEKIHPGLNMYHVVG